MHERVGQALFHRLLAPGEVLLALGAAALVAVGNFQQAIGRIWAAVEHHIFHAVAQLGVEVFIHAQLARVDDAHVHARLNRVVQKHGVDRFAHHVVAAERERYFGHAAAHLRVRQVLLDPARRFDEVDGIVVVLFDAGSDREDVRIKNDVFRGKADLVHQEVVAALADLGFALERVCLALFVESHDHGGRAVAPDQLGMVRELFFAFLERDRVDDRLALHALQTGLDHLPLGRVDHDRHARDVGLRGDQIQEANHRRLGIEHRLVHVDVDDLRAVFDLLACHGQRLVELAVQDHARERLGPGDVGALADVDEQRVLADVERFEARKTHGAHGVVGHDGAGFGQAAAYSPSFNRLPCGSIT